jgi:serine/threonine protein phosphatase 1
MKIFVMGDLHGAHRALLQCLDRAKFNKKRDTLIQLGDVADGHEEVYECVETLLRLPNLVSIMGNHDEWFREYLDTGYHPTEWTMGGAATARSYLRRIGKKRQLFRSGIGYTTDLDPKDIPQAHRAFFGRQQLYHIDKGRCFVHGGFDPTMAFDRQYPPVYYWNRELWRAALAFTGDRLPMATPFNEVYLGHTSTTNWKTDRPMVAAGVWNLDTGAGRAGRLTIMNIETKQFWQSDRVEELYGPAVIQPGGQAIPRARSNDG